VGNLGKRLTALERKRPAATPVFVTHGAAGPGGRCPDCEVGAVAHFTISIERAGGSVERRNVGNDLGDV
jgi:hypothetical protein